MNKKIASLAIGVLAAIMPSFAQKIDKNSLTSISLSNYPTVPIPMDYSSYALTDEKEVALDWKHPLSWGFNCYNKRFSKTETANGADIIIRFSGITDEYSPMEVYKSSGIQWKKGPRPKIPEFQAATQKTVGFYVDVITDAGVVFTDSIFESVSLESSWHRNPKIAEKELDSIVGAYEKRNEDKKLCLKSIQNGYSQKLGKIIGISYMDSYRFHVYSVKPKKKNDTSYNDLIKAAENFEKAADIIDKKDMDLDRYKQKAAASFATWNNALAKDGDPRITSEIKAALLYNMATYYVLQKEFTKANEYYNMALDAQKDFADAEKLVKLTKTWAKAKERYEAMMADFEAKK